MGYSLSILGIQNIVNNYECHYGEILKKYNLSLWYKEDLYDWMITKALHRVLQLTVDGSVYSYNKNETYEHIYQDYLVNNESIGYLIELEIDRMIRSQGISFCVRETVKLMVIHNNILIARGLNATI